MCLKQHDISHGNKIYSKNKAHLDVKKKTSLKRICHKYLIGVSPTTGACTYLDTRGHLALYPRLCLSEFQV